MAELYEIIGRSDSTSIQRIVRNTFFSENYFFQNGKMIIYFFDQLDPEEITDFVLTKKEMQIDYQYVYELVCRIQQKVINQFYKELDENKRQHFIKSYLSKRILLSDKERKQLLKALEKRMEYPYKRIRR